MKDLITETGELEQAIASFEKFKAMGYGHSNLPSSWNIELALAALRTQQPLTLAIRSVQAERNRQDEKWGDQNGNHPFEWVSILGEEYGELCEAVNETCFKNPTRPERGGLNKIRKEAVHVAAVAVALVEAVDRNDHGNIHDNPELVKEGNE